MAKSGYDCSRVHNREIFRFSRSGGRSRARRSLCSIAPKYSKIRHKSKDAKAVVVMLAHEGVTQPGVWEKFLDISDFQVGMAIYSEIRLQNKLECFRAPFFIPSGWGTFEVVQIEIKLLEYALKWYPDADLFYVLSGDSIPIRLPHEFINPECRENIMHAYELHDFEQRSLFTHFNSTWKQLTRDWVSKILATFEIKSSLLKQTQNQRLIEFGICVTSPAEWVIGSILHGSQCLNSSVPHPCKEIVDMDWISNRRKCTCKVNNAAEWNDFKGLKSRLEEAFMKPNTYKAFRKVGKSVCAEAIWQLIIEHSKK